MANFLLFLASSRAFESDERMLVSKSGSSSYRSSHQENSCKSRSWKNSNLRRRNHQFLDRKNPKFKWRKTQLKKQKKHYEGKLLKYDKVHKAISAIKTCSNLYFIKSFSIKYPFFSFWKCNIFLGHLLSNWEFLIFICKHYQILSNSKRKRSFN